MIMGMDHDFYSPVWADNHHKLSDGIASLFGAIGHAFRRLRAHQFGAPWHRPTRHIRVRPSR